MKKHLIALAVAGATAAPVMAQVSLYGIIDASVAQVESSGVTYTSQGNADYLNSSRLGFMGSEDLGGGLKAMFKLEGDLNVNNGRGDSTNGGLTFDREASVGIAGGFGSITIGRTFDPVSQINDDAQAGANLFDFKEADNTYTSISNNVRFDSASIMGWNLSASYSNDIANTEVGGDVTDGITQATSYTAFGVSGKVMGVTVKFALGKEDTTTTTTTYDHAALNLGYNFGFADVNLVLNTKETEAGVKSSDQQLGVVAPIGNGFNLRGSIARHSNDTATAERDAMGLLVEKALSKRTSVYAGYAKEDVNATGSTSDLSTSVIGVSHKF